MQEFTFKMKKAKMADTFSFNDGSRDITGRYVREKDTSDVVKVQLLVDDKENEATGKIINNEVVVDIGHITIALKFS